MNYSLRAMIAGHKLVSAAAAIVVLITLGLFFVAVLGPRAGRVDNSTSCSQWSSSSDAEQRSFAERYLSTHGNADQAAGVAGVEAAVNNGCMAAFSSDEEDSVTVLDAIEKRY